MQLIFDSPVWFLIPCAILAAGLTALLYFRNSQNQDLGLPLVLLLSLLRFSGIFLILFLLLSPLLRNNTVEKDPPIIIVLEDNSSSVSANWPQREQKLYLQNRATTWKDINDGFKTYFYQFGKDISPSNPDEELSFKEKETNISRALESVLAAHSGANIGAIVLASDGLYNQGLSPLYEKSIVGIPLYTVATGDSTVKKDVLIRQVRYNNLIYLGDLFEVKIDVSARLLSGNSTNLTVRDSKGTVLFTKSIAITDNYFSITVPLTLEAKQPGIWRYNVSLSSVTGEVQLANNKADIFVEVIDGRQKIAILYDAPHPDVKAIRSAIEANKNYTVEAIAFSQFKSADINAFNLFILHGLPSVKQRAGVNTIMSIANSGLPVWYITTAATDFVSLNAAQDLVNIKADGKNMNDVKARPDDDFSKFVVTPSAYQLPTTLPPLLAPFGQFTLNPSAEVCWWQNIGSVATKYPLLVMGQKGERKIVLLLGEGIWRWRMQEFANTGKQELTDEWIQKIVQFNTVKQQQQPLRIRSSKSIYTEQEPVYLDAILYNESYQAINDPDIKIVIEGDNNFSQQLTMDKTTQAYSLQVGLLPPGAYVVKASTNFKGKTLNGSVKLVVQSVLLESLNTQADYALLKNLASGQKGKMYSYRNMPELVNALKADDSIKPLLKNITHTKPLLDWKWLCLLILGLFSIEWFVRRISGKY
jgi:hypothetical protein